jgi:hypothetical protein
MSQAIPLRFAIERLCYAMRSISKHMSDSLIFLRGVILSGVESSPCELSAESKDPYLAGDS